MRLKNIIIILLFIGGIVFFTYKYAYKDHRNIKEETAAYALTAKELLLDYRNNAKVANNKYLDQVIEVHGSVSEIVSDSILVLNNAVSCSMLENIKSLNKSKEIILKGRVTGFDDLFEQVQIDQCSIIKY